MEREHYAFAMWAAVFLAGATGVILYQHAQHTRHLTGLFGNRLAGQTPLSVDAAALGPINDNNGRQSQIANSKTPLGGPLPGWSVFPYAPPQNQLIAGGGGWKPASPMNAYEWGRQYEDHAPTSVLNGLGRVG